MLALIAQAGAALLLHSALVVGWAPATISHPAKVNVLVRVQMACSIASIAVLIGALGASYEDQHYFRQVILVDEAL